MKRYLLSLSLIILLGLVPAEAVMKHSAETQKEYLKYHALVQKSPRNKSYLFDYAMVLAYMGKIEEAGAELKTINELDDSYAHKLIKSLEKQKQKNLTDWHLRFKLGFVYYFLFEEANGRIELAQRRIKRVKEHPEEFTAGTIEREEDIIQEKFPLANDYRNKALFNFQRVAEKEPHNNINAWGFAYMAVIKGIEKDWPAAVKFCEKALEIEPDAYAIRAAYMEALKQNGDLLGAAAQMTIALRLKSEQDAYEKELFGQEI
jgi:tetratricopeptide (TPR) repeat protein